MDGTLSSECDSNMTYGMCHLLVISLSNIVLITYKQGDNYMVEEIRNSQSDKHVLLSALIESNGSFKIFSALPLVEKMTDEHAKMIFTCMKEKRYQEGDVIYRAKEAAAGEMYLVLEGKVGVEGQNGYHYANLRAGDVFGLFSFLDDKRDHSATICAEKDTTVLVLERSYFDLIALEDPKLGQYLMYFMFRLLSNKALKMEVEYAHMHEFALGRKV